MGLLHINDFSGGWNPSMDQINGPPACFPKGDNLVLDEMGALSLRLGQLVTSGAVPLVPGGQVHSLFTTTIDGSRVRFAGVDDAVFRSQSAGIFQQVLSNFDGSGDIRMGTTLGQVFLARGTTKFKHDFLANTNRVWGVSRPSNAPTCQALPSDGKTFSTFNDGESPGWTAVEGTVTAGQGQDDAPSGARTLTPVSATGRGVMQKIFNGEQDFTSYDDGDTGTDVDLLTFYGHFVAPDNLEYMELAFDVNGDSLVEAARFRDDYYYVQVTLDDVISMKLDPVQDLDSVPSALPQYKRDLLEQQLERDGVDPTGARIGRRAPSSINAGWAKFQIPRGKFLRVGSTPGKNWSTVKAISVTIKYAKEEGGTDGVVRMDDMRILGGARHPLTGKYKVAAQYVSHVGKYNAKSGISGISEEIELQANGLRVSLLIPSTDYGWITDLHIYITGGTIPGFYRAAIRAASAPHTGSQTFSVDIEISDRDILIQGIQLDPNIIEPPDDIIDIAGPFDSRMFALTAEGIHPSLQGDPDAFNQDHKLVLPGRGATAIFLRNVAGEPILATDRDFYRIVGNGEESPDGLINYRPEALNVPPPISDFTAQEGNLLIYLAADGPRVFNGTTSTSLVGVLDLLFQGKARFNVNAPNLGFAPGRFRGAIFNGRLFLQVPEGSSDQTSTVVWVLNLLSGEWRREIYPQAFCTLYREPDGKILGGTSTGLVVQIQAREGLGDQVAAGGLLGTVSIPIEYWSKFLDGGNPLSFKEPEDFRIDIATDSLTNATKLVNVDLYGDGVLLGSSVLDVILEPIVNNSTFAAYRRLQVRMTGTYTNFKLRHWSQTYRRRPVPRLHWDSGFIRLGTQSLVHMRQIMLMARLQRDTQVKIYMDDELVATDTFLADGNLTSEYEVKLGREIWGRQVRITLSPLTVGLESVFEPYWLHLYYHTSGRQGLEKKFITIDGEMKAS